MANLREFFVRPMPPRDTHEKRAATQLELFFDLVSVIAIASATATMHHAIGHGHGLEILPRFIFIFLAIWWPWVNYTWFTSGFDNRDGTFKVLSGLIMLGYLIFAGGVAHIMETLDFGWGLLGWILMRLGMILLWLRAAQQAEEGLRKMCYAYAFGLFLAQALWTSLYFCVRAGILPFDETLFMMIGSLIYLLEFLVPIIASRFHQTPFNFEHLVERYGLLNIIVLGEALLSISFAFAAFYEGSFDFSILLTCVWSFITVFLLWWIYFIDTKEVGQASGWQLYIWSMFHFLVFFGGTWLGASLAAGIDFALHENHMEPRHVMLFIGWPMAIYLAGIWLVREQFHMFGKRMYILPIAALLILLASYLVLPVWVFPLILAAALLLRVRFTPMEDLNI